MSISLALDSEITESVHEEHSEFDHSATYSPEDDKIRIYLQYRIPADEYKKITDLGFRNAPKQGCQFAIWSPQREDFALALAGNIEPEGMSLAERAAIKADRLENLAYKNIGKANAFHKAANAISERFAFGQPILVGHHSERRARKDKERMGNAMRHACRCADAVNYWNYRATSVERHANAKNSESTRTNRIRGLLAELRKMQRNINDSYLAIRRWEMIERMQGKDSFEAAVKYYSGMPDASPYINDCSAWSLLEDGKISAEEVMRVSLDHHRQAVSYEMRFRWIEHLLNRLAYERAEQGEVELYEGELTPVILQAFLREFGADTPKSERTGAGYKAVSLVPFPLHICENLSTEIVLSESEWREKMQACGYVVPEKKQRRANSSDKASIPLINPTKEDAERLQALWNRNMEKAAEGKTGIKAKTNTVSEFTQQVYSYNSKGNYSPFETVELDASGKEITQRWQGGKLIKSGEPVCRIRISTINGEFYKPHSVIVITDKSAKAIPLDWSQVNG